MYEWLKPLVLRLLSVEIPKPVEGAGVAHQTVREFRACPAFLRYRLLGWMIFTGASVLTLPILTIVIFATTDVVGWISAIFLDLLMLATIFIFYFTVRIDYEMRSYRVTDRSLRIREGVFLIREMTLTYANIQNVKLSQGPLERLFGFRNLEVETAGGGGGHSQHKQSAFSFHVGYLRGIDNAEEVRALIQRRMEASGKARPAALATAPQVSSQPEPGGERDALRAILEQTKRLRANLAADQGKS